MNQFYGVTQYGFKSKRLAVLKTDLEELFVAEFGEVNTAAQSVIGQIIGIFSKVLTDNWENLEDVYFSQYPNSASGVSLDNVVSLNGITRLQATRTTVIGAATGFEGTLIPFNSLASVNESGEVFSTTETSYITRTNSIRNIINVASLVNDRYTVLINNVTFTYSYPIITFTGSFVTANVINPRINGVSLPIVNYTTSSANTIQLIADSLETSSAVSSATVSGSTILIIPNDGFSIDTIVLDITGGVSQPSYAITYAVPAPDFQDIIFTGSFVTSNVITPEINGVTLPIVNYTTSSPNTLQLIANSIATSSAIATATVTGNTIKLVPNDGFTITVDNIDITGGVTQPTYNVVPDDVSKRNYIAQKLSLIIDQNSTVVSSAYFAGSTFTITALNVENPYSVNVFNGLSISSITSPVNFIANNYRSIPVPIGSLTNILTPIAGWQSLTNFTAGVIGRNRETDAELRLRRQNSIKIQGYATVEAIRARILQEVPGVTSVLIFENVTMTQSPIVVTFNTQFVSGNSVQPVIDGVNLSVIPYTTSHSNTMSLLAQELTNDPRIESAIVSGSGDLVLTVTMEQFENLEIEFNIVQVSGNPNYTTGGGRPPKSFETVVAGGSDSDIAYKIWQTKPAGIQTFGNILFPITDSMGNTQPIYFSRATSVYIWVRVTIVLNPQETFPSNGIQQIQAAILQYGNSLGIGIDVFRDRVLAQVFTVQGVASAVVELARTASPNDIPSYSLSDIAIQETEVSVWSLDRISVGI